MITKEKRSYVEGPANIELHPLSVVFVGLLVAFSAFSAGYFYGQSKANALALAGGTPSAANAGNAAGQPAAAQPTPDLSAMPPLSNSDHIRGSLNADAVLVEYSDYECPFCKQFHPTMQQVMKDYGNKVAWVFRNYPLSFHPKAEKSAEAAECVNELGGNDKYWAFTDAVYEKMPALELNQLVDVAASVGIDRTKFTTCLDSGKYKDKIAKDEAGGTAAGIQGTPGTIIIGKNGKKTMIPGALPYEQVKPMIDQILAG